MQEHVKSMEEEKDAIQASIRDSQCLSIFQLTSKLEKLQDEVAKTQVYHSYPDIDTVSQIANRNHSDQIRLSGTLIGEPWPDDSKTVKRFRWKVQWFLWSNKWN